MGKKKVNRLESLLLRNFKCFADLKIQFGQLTILTGVNGAGKSTSYQPILLLSEAIRNLTNNPTEQNMAWPLNGDKICLGSPDDVFNEYSPNKLMHFGFEFNDAQEVSFDFKREKGRQNIVSETVFDNEKKNELVKPIKNLGYISANRDVMDYLYPYVDQNELPVGGVGADGRNTCNLYEAMHKRDNNFRRQVNNWLDQLVPGASVQVDPYPQISKLALYFKMTKASVPKKPTNVGFGLSYVFPIVVELLASKNSDLIIIDSPEAHLHPQAQSRIASLIAKYAGEGRQIVVETHSENFINGIRLAVKNNIISPEDVSILFFSGPNKDAHGVKNPVIDQKGNLSDWPKGFFDQIDSDLLELIGIE